MNQLTIITLCSLALIQTALPVMLISEGLVHRAAIKEISAAACQNTAFIGKDGLIL